MLGSLTGLPRLSMTASDAKGFGGFGRILMTLPKCDKSVVLHVLRPYLPRCRNETPPIKGVSHADCQVRLVRGRSSTQSHRTGFYSPNLPEFNPGRKRAVKTHDSYRPGGSSRTGTGSKGSCTNPLCQVQVSPFLPGANPSQDSRDSPEDPGRATRVSTPGGGSRKGLGYV